VIRTGDLEVKERSSRWLSDDWRDEDDRATIAEAFARSVNLTLDFQTGNRSHARRLVVEFADGRQVQLLFDQGFGAWRSERGAGFDFREHPVGQARALKTIQTGVHIPPGMRTFIVAERLGK
jgi:hypothetical protein